MYKSWWAPWGSSPQLRQVIYHGFFWCFELMWVSVHDTSDSCVALLWLVPLVKACFEKYNQCFSGGMMIISALFIKCKMDASQTFVKVSRYDIPSRLFLKNKGYHLRQQILMHCIVNKSSENYRWWIQFHYLHSVLDAWYVCLTLWRAIHWHSNTVPS